MKHLPCRTLAVTVLCLFAACATTASGAPKVEWRIAAREDKDGNPRSKVDLVINDKQVVHVVPNEVIMRYEVLTPAQYAEHDVPARALCACTSWWAGGGTNYYVVPAGEGKLYLFRQDLDEESLTSRYKKDRAIKIESP